MELRTFSYIERIRKADTDFAAILATVATICEDIIQPGVTIEAPIWSYAIYYAEQHGIPAHAYLCDDEGFAPYGGTRASKMSWRSKPFSV